MASPNGPAPPNASMTAEKLWNARGEFSMSKSLHEVATIVNTACSGFDATLCSVGRTVDPKMKAKMKAMGERLAAARLQAGFRSARAAALEFGWAESTYRSHEAGTRTIGYDDAQRYVARFRHLGARITARDIHYGDAEEKGREDPVVSTIPVMGRIGAGAVIEPEYEQVPADGLSQIEFAFPLPDGLIAFEVDGTSMLPKYNPGDVVVTWAEPRRPIESFYGQQAVVLTKTGQRYLKKIIRGKSGRTVDLHSYDGRDPIENVRLEWIGQIFTTFPASEITRIEKHDRHAKHMQPKSRPRSK
jgi:phage repressor protein C with HTH and peptisase S24 domain